MPSLARKILVIAAVDGLILSPLQNQRSRSPPLSLANSVRVEYKSNKITPLPGVDKQLAEPTKGVEAHGIVGLLNVSQTNSFLIAITGRESVATIKAKYPVYVITNIALIPLSSQKDAQHAIDKATQHRKPVEDGNESDTEGELEAEEEAESNEIVDDEVREEISNAGKAAAAPPQQERTSIGEDVIRQKGAYGRFATKWFSKRGWTVDKRRQEGMSTEQSVPDFVPGESSTPKPEDMPAASAGESSETAGGPENIEPKDAVEEKVEDVQEAVQESVAHSLTPKLLHTTKLLLATSRCFYFSYEWDITRSWGSQVNNSSGIPLFKIVDPTFFWNKHLQRDFIDSGQHSFVLPLMQGFIGQRTFAAMPLERTSPEPSSESHEAETAAGVSTVARSQDFAESAPSTDPSKNLVLTLISRRSTKRAGLRYLRRGTDDHGNVANFVETEQLLSTPSWDRVFSYLQIRGSIPLYFSQSPYSLKPRPVLFLSTDANLAAARTHFNKLRTRYGDVHIVNLVESHGPEAVVGDKYRDTVAELNLPGVGWTWFDFHHECRGMRFENVSRLFEDIGPTLDGFSYTTELDGTIESRQRGVLRTNCMDCLDRTNVVQSGSAHQALDAQLSELSTNLPEEHTNWFNILWADNGDAISKQYASTAALKGDFTRTRKRNLQGALTDFGLTLTRYFTNIISDFFTQAAIDFLLGNVSAQVFLDFEAEMTSSDPAVSLKRVRQNAVEISSKIVVEDDAEDLRGGWTFLAPREEAGSLRATMREVVLLLTDRALYRCEFDWALEKVSAFERVPVDDVVGIQWGAYITSTLASSHVDENRNVGVAVRCEMPKEGGVVRVNTRALKNEFTTEEAKAGKDRVKRWCFKAMPGAADDGSTEREWINGVVQEARRCCPHAEVEEKDIVSLAEAKKGTGLLEQWGYTIKRMVWA